MERIFGSRRSGKTTKLIELAAKKGYILVEPNMRMANFAKSLAKEKGYNIEIITPYQLFELSKGTTKKYLVDELDIFLGVLGIVGYSNSIIECPQEETWKINMK